MKYYTWRKRADQKNGIALYFSFSDDWLYENSLSKGSARLKLSTTPYQFELAHMQLMRKNFEEGLLLEIDERTAWAIERDWKESQNAA